ncbi:MAG TPA: hypothetical protein VKD23_08620, partial [Terriglobales bacterium]|nr:hypothetical protein [Terriglobales bacterium]
MSPSAKALGYSQPPLRAHSATQPPSRRRERLRDVASPGAAGHAGGAIGFAAPLFPPAQRSGADLEQSGEGFLREAEPLPRVNSFSDGIDGRHRPTHR